MLARYMSQYAAARGLSLTSNGQSRPPSGGSGTTGVTGCLRSVPVMRFSARDFGLRPRSAMSIRGGRRRSPLSG